MIDIEFMQAIKKQFPEENGYVLYTSSRLTFVDFPACLQFIPEENESCTVVMDHTNVSMLIYGTSACV